MDILDIKKYIENKLLFIITPQSEQQDLYIREYLFRSLLVLTTVISTITTVLLFVASSLDGISYTLPVVSTLIVVTICILWQMVLTGYWQLAIKLFLVPLNVLTVLWYLDNGVRVDVLFFVSFNIIISIFLTGNWTRNFVILFQFSIIISSALSGKEKYNVITIIENQLIANIVFVFALAITTIFLYLYSKEVGNLLNKNKLYADVLEQEIQERVKVEVELIEAKDTAENAQKRQEETFANMSHEIRTPLSSVIGITDLLQSTKLTSKQTEYVDSLKLSGNNLLLIVNDILDFTKASTTKLQENIKVLHIHSFLKSFESTFKYQCTNKGIDFITSIDDSILPSYKVDIEKLRLVLSNLLVNAIRFTDNGYVKLSVKKIKGDEKKHTIRFVIEDTGIGIQKENLDKIFQSFYQVEQGSTKKYGGTGLGLSIVKKLSDVIDANVSVQSKVGEGTTFFVDIDMERNQEVESIDDKEKSQEDMKLDYEILLVEDNVLNVVVIKKLIEKLGARVSTASSGFEAIEKIKGQVFDVILMDIQMPGMDGYTTTAKIRQELKITTPIIALTAHIHQHEKDQAFAAGMNEYLTKPFKLEDLHETIQKLLDR